VANAEDRQPHAVLDPESRLLKARKIEELLARARPLTGSRVLDVGTGSGVIAGALAETVGPEGEVWAVDIVDQRVVTDGYRFVQVSNPRLPFDEASFDIVVSNHVLDHVGGAGDKARHLAEVARVLRDNGVCYLAVANRWVVVEPHFRLPFLSWLPERLRTPYVRLARRGTFYDCDLPSRSELLELLAASPLRHEELTIEAMRALASIERLGAVTTRILTAPERALRRLLPVIPTMVFLLRK
jgi:SAM-dependent methyltransferase